jgi:hypothetical protein
MEARGMIPDSPIRTPKDQDRLAPADKRLARQTTLAFALALLLTARQPEEDETSLASAGKGVTATISLAGFEP